MYRSLTIASYSVYRCAREVELRRFICVATSVKTFSLHVGFTCEQHDNPADFFLDVIIRYEKRTRLQKEETVHFNPGEEENAVVLEESQVHFVESYRKSAEYQEIRKSIDPLLQNVREEVEREGVASRISTKIFGQKSFATNFFWEVSGVPTL